MSFFRYTNSRSSANDFKGSSNTPFFRPQAKLKVGEANDKYEREADAVADKVVSKGDVFGSSEPFFKPQAKLNIGNSNDKYEKEADAVADKVVQKKGLFGAEPFFTPAPTLAVQRADESENEVQKKEETEQIQEKPIRESITPLVQTKEEEPADVQRQERGTESDHKESDQEEPVQTKDEEAVQKEEAELQTSLNDKSLSEAPVVQRKEEEIQEKEEEIQEKEGDDEIQRSSTVDTGSTSNLESNLASSKGGGSPMDSTTKDRMESGFGADFSGVRIHNDSNSVQMNKELGSHAFANGNDIYFNEGKYNPSSTEGQHLLAHELTHTVQQGASTQPAAQTKIQSNPSAPQIQKQNGGGGNQNGNQNGGQNGNQNGNQNGQQTSQQTSQQNQNNVQQRGNQNTNNQQNSGNNTNQQTNQNATTPNAGNNQQNTNPNNDQANNANPANQNANGGAINTPNVDSPQGNQEGVTTAADPQQAEQNDGGAQDAPGGFPTYEAFTAFVTERKQTVAAFYIERNRAIDEFIRVERERAIAQVNAEILRLRETRTQVIGNIDRTFTTVETAINTKRNNEIEKARETAETELIRIDTITIEKQTLVQSIGESKAQAVIETGNEQANLANQSTNEKVRNVDTIIRRKSSQYANTDSAEKVTQSAWESKPDTVSQIRESGRTISDTVTNHARDLANNYRTDSANVARKFIESKNEARTKVIENRDETINALRSAGTEAVEGLRTETNNLKREIESGITQQINALTGLPERITEELYDVEIHVKAKLREDERRSIADIDKFAKDIGEIYWHRDEVADAQRDLEQAITAQENDVNTFVTESNTRLTTGITSFLSELVAAQNRVIPTFTQIETDYTTAATQVQTDTIAAIDEVAVASETGAKTIGDDLANGMDGKITEEETKWNTQLGQDVADMRTKVREGIQQQSEILERFESNLDREFNKGNDFWSFISGVFSGFWEGFTSLLSALWEAMGTLLFWIVVLIIVLFIVFLVVVVGVTLAVIGKVLLIIGIVIGVIAFLYFLISAIVTEGLTPNERGRLLGRGLFELAFSLIGSGVYARLMGWIPRIGRIVAIVARVGSWGRFLRIVAKVKDVKAFVSLIDRIQDLEALLRLMDRVKHFDDLVVFLSKVDDLERVMSVLSQVNKADDLVKILTKADDVARILGIVEDGIRIGKANAIIELMTKTTQLRKLLVVFTNSGDDFAKIIDLLENAPDLNRMIIAMEKVHAENLGKLVALLTTEGVDIAKVISVIEKTSEFAKLFRAIGNIDDTPKLILLLDKVTELDKLLSVFDKVTDANRLLRLFENVTEFNKLVTILDRTTEIGILMDFCENVTDINRAIVVLEGLAGKIDDFIKLRDLAKGITSDKLLQLIDKITDVDKIATILSKTANIDDLIRVLGKIDDVDLAKFINYLVVKIKDEATLTKFLSYFDRATDTGMLLKLFDAHGSTTGFIATLDKLSDFNQLITVGSNLGGGVNELKNLVKALKQFPSELDDLIAFFNGAASADLADLVYVATKMSGTSLTDFKTLATLADNIAQLRAMMDLRLMTGNRLLGYFTKAGGAGQGADLLSLLRRADGIENVTRAEQFLNQAGGVPANFNSLWSWLNRFPFPPGPAASQITITQGSNSWAAMMDHICGRHTMDAFQWIAANVINDTTLFPGSGAGGFATTGEVATLLDTVMSELHRLGDLPTLAHPQKTVTLGGVVYRVGVRLDGSNVVIGQFHILGAIDLTAAQLAAFLRLF